jgi:hypothetical protein
MLKAVSGITRAQAAALTFPPTSGPRGQWFSNGRSARAPFGADILYLYWFPLPRALTITLMRMRTLTGGAGSAVKYAIWGTDPVTGRPTGVPLIGQNTGLSTATSGTFQDTVIASVVLNQPNGIFVGSKLTGTMPVMLANNWAIGPTGTTWPIGAGPLEASSCYSIVSPYAADIMAENLTGAALGSYTNDIPALYMEYA